MEQVIIQIGDKTYKVKLARTQEERITGLSNITTLPEDEGMLFEYPDVQDSVQFTMENTAIPLDIIFIDEYGEVIKKSSAKNYSKQPITCEDVLYVLEVNINSGIQVGDELEELEEIEEDDEDTLTEEDKKIISGNKMLILDSDGNVQYKLEGGERIFSRIMTRKMIKQALTAYKLDTDDEYKKLGKLVFKELQAQDSREAEYVEVKN